MTQASVYLVSYDITNRARWRRVFKALNRACEHAQLSVFLCRLSKARMDRLQARLSGAIDLEEDRLMVVALGTPETARERLRGTALPPAPRPVIV